METAAVTKIKNVTFYFSCWVCYFLTFCMWQEREQEIREFLNQPANKISRFDFLLSLVELMLSGQAMDGAGWHEAALCMAVGQSALVHTVSTWIKVALGIGLCALVSYCLAFTQANHCQWRITKATFNRSGIYCEIRGGGGWGCLPKCFLGRLRVGGGPLPWNLRASVWSKNKGVASPLDPPLYYRTVLSALVLL